MLAHPVLPPLHGAGTRCRSLRDDYTETVVVPIGSTLDFGNSADIANLIVLKVVGPVCVLEWGVGRGA